MIYVENEIHMFLLSIVRGLRIGLLGLSKDRVEQGYGKEGNGMEWIIYLKLVKHIYSSISTL